MTKDPILLVERIAALEARISELGGYLRSALEYLSSDPQSSLTKSRISLEKLLLALYRNLMKREPSRPMIGDILADKTFAANIPRRILFRMYAIRDMSNLGPHGGDVVMADAARVMNDLVDVLDWYVINYDSSAIQTKSTFESQESIEILHQLKSKFPHYIRPGIASVRFSQTQDRCFLEVHTADLDGGYLQNEAIKRDDLAFITDEGGADSLFFDPSRAISANAQRFVAEFDELSIINCTDLFTEEATMIYDHWRRYGQLPPRMTH